MHWFASLEVAQATIEAFRRDYKVHHPHRSLGPRPRDARGCSQRPRTHLVERTGFRRLIGYLDRPSEASSRLAESITCWTSSSPGPGAASSRKARVRRSVSLKERASVLVAASLNASARVAACRSRVSTRARSARAAVKVRHPAQAEASGLPCRLAPSSSRFSSSRVSRRSRVPQALLMRTPNRAGWQGAEAGSRARPMAPPTRHTIHGPPVSRPSGASGAGTMCREFRRPARRAATTIGAGWAAAGRTGSAAASAARSATIRATWRSIMRLLRHTRALCVARRPGRRGPLMRDAGRNRSRRRPGAARGEQL